MLTKYYDGPTDAQGRSFTIGGYAPGSELQWGLPNSATAQQGGPGGGMAGGNIKYLLLPPCSRTTS